jgi:hypothetical protein
MPARTPPEGARRGAAAVRSENARIAALLSDYADLLEQQGGDGFRLRAYREAAHEIVAAEPPLRSLFEAGGAEALIALPTIGKGIAAAIAEILTQGRWTQLERLKGDVSPQTLFRTLPGIGPKLAQRLADDYGLETLEDLEAALHLGTARIAGIGPRRKRALAAVLAERLGRNRMPVLPLVKVPEPPVEVILQADALYRARVAEGSLKKIAPKRFNPSGAAWLPVMHARHEDWHFTLLQSNTALAHQLGRTEDWVVAYFQKDGGPEARHTIVTETRGALAGKRVVRGREGECARYYAAAG